MWWSVVGCQSGHHQEKAVPKREDITMAWLADGFMALIEKSMSICASSSPGRLPARLKSPNEAWSRYLIPDSLSQSDFAGWSHPPIRDLGGEFNMNHAACCCCCFCCFAVHLSALLIVEQHPDMQVSRWHWLYILGWKLALSFMIVRAYCRSYIIFKSI